MAIQVTVIQGRLAKDVELGKTNGGTTTGKFSVAVDKRNAAELKKQGKPTANFYSCKAYGKTAETISTWFHKGSEIILNGYMDQWSVVEGNTKRSGWDFVVNDFSFTSGSNASQNASNDSTERGNWDEPNYEAEPSHLIHIGSEDLPF